MLTALVLVCSLSTTPDLSACDGDNAVHVIQVPGAFASPVTCFLHGQAYLAQTSVGENLAPDNRVKVICEIRGSLTENAPPRRREPQF